MAGKRIDIMDLRQLFRLKKENLSNRKVAEVLNVSRNTVNGYIHLIKAFNLKYDELLKLDESELLGLFPDKSEIQKHRFNQLSEYFSYLEGELKKPGCTLEALWREYFEKLLMGTVTVNSLIILLIGDRKLREVVSLTIS